MKTLKAIVFMSIWTLSIIYVLYLLEAHLHYQNVFAAVLIGFVLLVTHMINMVLYFKIAGKTPYKWFSNGQRV
jgi:hypothetical protein